MDKYAVLLVNGKIEYVTAKNAKEAELIVNKKYHVGIEEVWKEVDDVDRGTKKGIG